MIRLAALLFCLIMPSAQAEAPSSNKFGLGITLGSVVAVDGKYWIDRRSALDFGVGYSGSDWTVLYGQYLWHIPGVFGRGTKFGRETLAYVGGGAGFGFWRDNDGCGRWNCNWNEPNRRSGTGIFLRGLFGFEWFPARTPFGVFGEVGPSVMIAPDTGGTLDIDVGGRFYF